MNIDLFFKLLGGFGIFIITMNSVPQIYKMIKTKRTDDVSGKSLMLLLLGILMAQVYSSYFQLWEMFIPNNVTIITCILQLILKKCYDTKIETVGILDKEIDFLQNAEENFSQDLGLDDAQLIPYKN